MTRIPLYDLPSYTFALTDGGAAYTLIINQHGGGLYLSVEGAIQGTRIVAGRNILHGLVREGGPRGKFHYIEGELFYEKV